MKSLFKIFGVLAIVVIAVFLLWDILDVRHEATNGSREDEEGYKNATYEIDGTKITLVNGVSEVDAAPGSSSKIITRYFGNEARGDMNGDEKEDVTFLLTQEGGGSGTFYYAVVALNAGERYEGTNAVLLGDRVAPQGMEIRNHTLIVNYADRASGEPMTTPPSLAKSLYLVIENSILLETPVFVESPEWGARVSSPLVVRGVARGTWFFEATLPLILIDKGSVIARGFATAEGEWMTTDYVRFSGILEFNNSPRGMSGMLVVKKDNPSGLPEHDDQRQIPIVFE